MKVLGVVQEGTPLFTRINSRSRGADVNECIV
jgi:hypothetical protein